MSPSVCQQSWHIRCSVATSRRWASAAKRIAVPPLPCRERAEVREEAPVSEKAALLLQRNVSTLTPTLSLPGRGSNMAAALLTTCSLAAACAVLSVFVVLRRWALLGEGVAH